VACDRIEVLVTGAPDSEPSWTISNLKTKSFTLDLTFVSLTEARVSPVCSLQNAPMFFFGSQCRSIPLVNTFLKCYIPINHRSGDIFRSSHSRSRPIQIGNQLLSFMHLVVLIRIGVRRRVLRKSFPCACSDHGPFEYGNWMAKPKGDLKGVVRPFCYFVDFGNGIDNEDSRIEEFGRPILISPANDWI
jgi:hypothetical protein